MRILIHDIHSRLGKVHDTVQVRPDLRDLSLSLRFACASRTLKSKHRARAQESSKVLCRKGLSPCGGVSVEALLRGVRGCQGGVRRCQGVSVGCQGGRVGVPVGATNSEYPSGFPLSGSPQVWHSWAGRFSAQPAGWSHRPSNASATPVRSGPDRPGEPGCPRGFADPSSVSLRADRRYETNQNADESPAPATVPGRGGIVSPDELYRP